MARMMRSSFKRPINSLKHVVDTSGTTLGGTVSVVPIVETVRNPEATAPTNVQAGATVGSVYLSLFFLGSSGTVSGLIDWYLIKNPANSFGVATIPTPGNTGIEQARRFIFHEEKGLAGTEDGATMVFKGVIKIPPRFRRMGDQDELQIRILTANDMQFCVKAIYKEYQ